MVKKLCSEMDRIHGAYAVDKREQKLCFLFGEAVFGYKICGCFGSHGEAEEKACDQTVAAIVTDVKHTEQGFVAEPAKLSGRTGIY